MLAKIGSSGIIYTRTEGKTDMLTGKHKDRKLITVPPERILSSPFQPRREFDRYELLELAASIKANGLIQPLTVRERGEMYELISGERRLKASVIAGLKTVPCILVKADDRECSLMCLIENIQRTDLNFIEEAEGIRRLMDEFMLSGQEAAAKLGMAQSTLSNKLRILRMTDEQKRRTVSAGLSERHARALIRLPDEERDDVLNRVIAEQLSSDDTERLVDQMLLPDKELKEKCHIGNIGDIRIFSNSLKRIIGTIRRSGVDAKSYKNETDDFIEYTITIPKSGKGRAAI